MTRSTLTYALLAYCLILTIVPDADAQETIDPSEELSLDDHLSVLKWRCVGPYRGGRSTTVSGVVQESHTFYFGSTGGGVWKTTNGGYSWHNVTDGYLNTGSIGAIAVAPSDPNVVYVGTGEAPVRGVMTSSGDGVYKSTDGGKSWQHLGLEKTLHISQIRIHPEDPDMVYVAAQGSPYGPSEERGVYRSEDGGSSWEKIHFVDENSGVSDLSIDMRNPRVLYAAFWDHTRLPWYIRSGGEGSGIWKTTDGGDSWNELTAGLPDSIMGKIGVSVSPANSNRVYAIIESKQGGLYRSDNAGETWKLMNDQRVLRARSWYYMHVFADPQDANTVHVMNAPYMRSTDGGKTFARVSTPHGDNHALWVNPSNTDIMINGNDGGANVSYDRGATWSTQANQPTAQFYRVTADNREPYWIYGGQQDNSTVCIVSKTDDMGISMHDFHAVGGCESAFCAFNPDDPRYVYATCIQGIITEYDAKTEMSKDIMAYTDLMLGKNPKNMKYRFNWNAPVIVSSHDPNVIYHGGNLILKSEDRGVSWAEISPDLTKNVEEHIDWGGGPITNEGAGGENYHTIMYISESAHDANELWAGTDDGLVQLTRDGGETWSDVTPDGIEEGMINAIELSPHETGTAFIAFNRYKFGDFTPYIYRTDDHGASWTRIDNGIEGKCHVRVVREDDSVAGLLYAGTERGLFVSWDDGAKWERLQLNLPVTPITDLKVHRGGLIASTQGRAFWVLDDLTLIRQWNQIDTSEIVMLKPRPASIWGGSRNDSLRNRGANPDYGLIVYFNVPDPDTALTIQITDAAGRLVRTFATGAEKEQAKLNLSKGINKHIWNLRRENLESIPGLMTFGGTAGTRMGPGEYTVALQWGDGEEEAFLVEITDNPNSEIPQSAHDEKQKLLWSLHTTSQEVFDEVKNIRYIKEQIRSFQKRDGVEGDTVLFQAGESIISELDSLELTVVQAKQQTFQDVINYPNQIDGELMHVQSVIDGSYPPLTQGQTSKVSDIMTEWSEKKERVRQIVENELATYNELIRERSIPFISPSSPNVSVKKSKT